MKNKRKKRGKKILISLVALAVAGGIGAGVWYSGQRNVEPVGVYPFDYLGMTEYWGDSRECYGNVTTDRIQTIYLSDTQTVTDILVKEGDQVKKGDTLMTFDTTLSELEMERKRLEVEKIKIELEDAKKELQKLLWMSPRRTPDYSEMPEPDYGRVIDRSYEIAVDRRAVPYEQRHDGSTPEKAIICWLESDYYRSVRITYDLIWDMLLTAEDIRGEILPDTGEVVEPEEPFGFSSASALPEEGGDFNGDADWGALEEVIGSLEQVPDETAGTSGAATDAPTYPTEAPTHPTEAPTYPTDAPTSPTIDPGVQWPTLPDEPVYPEPTEPDEPYNPYPTDPDGPVTLPTDPWPTLPEEPTFPEEPTEPEWEPIGELFVVIKVTDGDQIKGGRLVWQGIHVFRNGSIAFFDAGGVEDYSLPEEEEEEQPVVDLGGPYSYNELIKMRSEQEKKVKNTELSLKMAQANYEIMLREVNDGKVYAELDGEVISLLDEEEARNNQQPVLKVSGGGGFYMEGSVSELERADLKIGQEVTINDYRNGQEYTGTIQAIMDYPGRNGWSGRGNPNSSFYPFTVYIDSSADLQEGSWVNCTFSTGGENGIYLQNAFIRTEKGESYIYVRGADSKLEKRIVETGKSLWGSYTEIKSGLTAEDYLAFPYGKTVREGVPTEEKDISELYRY